MAMNAEIISKFHHFIGYGRASLSAKHPQKAEKQHTNENKSAITVQTFFIAGFVNFMFEGK